MTDEPRPQTDDRTQAIDAGAKALHAEKWDGFDDAEEWRELSTVDQAFWSDMAGAAYDAMAPIIRGNAVEAFAAELRDGLDQLERRNIGRLVSPGDVADLIARLEREAK